MSSQASVANIASRPVWSASGCVGEAQQGGTTMVDIVRDVVLCSGFCCTTGRALIIWLLTASASRGELSGVCEYHQGIKVSYRHRRLVYYWGHFIRRSPFGKVSRLWIVLRHIRGREEVFSRRDGISFRFSEVCTDRVCAMPGQGMLEKSVITV